MIQKGKISSVEDYSPRPRRGGRPLIAPLFSPGTIFIPPPSAWWATAALRLLHPRRPISIHALREEGD